MCDCSGSTGTGRFIGGAGGKLGDLAEHKIKNYAKGQFKRFKSWTGLGDYKLITNSLVNGYAAGERPEMSVQGRRVRIKYREYIGDIRTHPDTVGQFNVRSFNLQPADWNTFPWLAAIASNYDQYKPLGMMFEMRSTATDSSTTPNLGSVMMATEYDVFDQPYSTKKEMLNSAYSSEAKMSDDMVHGIECDPRELQRNLFYIRPTGTALPNNANLRDYRLGTFHVATNGGSIPANTVVGSLYVHYEFEFLKEQLEPEFAPSLWMWQMWTSPIKSRPTGDSKFPNWGMSTGTYENPVYPSDTIISGFDTGIVLNNQSSGVGLPNVVIPQTFRGLTLRLTFMYASDLAGGLLVPVIATPMADIAFAQNCSAHSAQGFDMSGANNGLVGTLFNSGTESFITYSIIVTMDPHITEVGIVRWTTANFPRVEQNVGVFETTFRFMVEVVNPERYV